MCPASEVIELVTTCSLMTTVFKDFPGHMKRLLTCTFILTGLTATLQAAPIPKLFNTGVNDAGAALGPNTVDPHYEIVEIPEFVVVSSNAFTLSPGFPVGPWIAESPLSRWIAPMANQSTGSAAGNYIYRTTFDLTGFDPTKASITGRWVSDNGGMDIVINGVSLGLTNPGNFDNWTDANAFTITTDFVAGTNTLDFVVNNAGTDINPTGLRVEMRGTVELPDEAPSIVVQPTGSTVVLGEDIQLSVTANGTPPLTYRWKRNGTDVPGATDATFVITGSTLAQAGDYTVTVKNAFGEQTSALVKVAVLEPVPGLFNTGVDDTGTVLEDGAIDPHYKLVVNPDSASTDAIVHDSSVFPIVSGPWLANSDLSKWIGPQFDTVAAAGGDYGYRISFNLGDFDPTTVMVTGSWATDNPGTDILVNGASSGVQNTAGFGALTRFTVSSGFISGTNTLEFRVRNDAAGYTGLRVEGLRAGANKKTSTGTEPVRIVAQPQGGILFVGDRLTLNVVADGTAPISYQWRKDGQDLAGQTQASLVVDSVAAANAGSYSVRVSNAGGGVDSSVATITILQPIAGLFNTGVDASGNPLEDGAVDSHYQLSTNAHNPDSLEAVVEDSTVFPIVAGPWIANNTASKWIGPQFDPNGAGGDYAYRTSFTIEGIDPATVRLIGQWATDNVGTDILVNGTSTGLQNSAQFGGFTSFTITNGFKTGLNTIEFVVNNAGADANPTGLRVEGLRAGGQPSGQGGTGIQLASVINRGVAISLAWTGGTPPFLVQRKSKVTDTNWFDVITTSDREVTLPKEGETGFFRIQDQTTRTVQAFTALINGASENPAVETAGNGIATLALEGTNLRYSVSYSQLSGNATAGHIHGSANALNNAGVMVPFTGPFGSAGVITGTATLTPEQLTALRSGMTYVNLHTAAHGGGEVRGQIVPLQLRTALTGAAEVPPVTTSATANAVITLIGTEAFFDIDYDQLSSNATAAHLHGPAEATATAPPIIPFPNPTGTAGAIQSSARLTGQQLVDLLTGKTYLNIHTANHGGGELRGQVVLP